MPPAEIESAPSPPEGDALSAELWGRIGFILTVNPLQRKPLTPPNSGKSRENLVRCGCFWSLMDSPNDGSKQTFGGLGSWPGVGGGF